MSISSQLEENYFNPSSEPSISSILSELLAGNATGQPTLSGFLQELLLITPNSTISALAQSNNVPTLVIAAGIDRASGRAVLFEPTDTLTNNVGTPYRSVTGIQGLTGLLGLTGIRGLIGSTGIQGITGIAGLTGTSVIGLTGVQGETGVTGNTGISGVMGPTGVSRAGATGLGVLTRIRGSTGAIGITGSAGISGIAGHGFTGSQGVTGVIGITGTIGITGAIVSGLTVQGDTGVSAGTTGLQGVSGVAGIEGSRTFETLTTIIQNFGTTASYTLPANTLDADNQQLEIIVWGSSAASGQDTTLTLQFGGNVLLTRTISGVFGAAFSLKAKVIRLASSSEENICGLINSANGFFCQRSTTSLSLSSAQVIDVSVSSPDALIEVMLVRKVWQ